MGILSFISSKLKSSFNLVMKVKKTIQVFRVNYKYVWNEVYKVSHDLTQEVENILQKKIDFEHRDTFSRMRNKLIDEFGITWKDSGKMAHDIIRKPEEDLSIFEHDLRADYDTP